MPDDPPHGQTVDDGTRQLALVSLFYPAFYLGVSWAISLRRIRRKRRRGPEIAEIHG
jgi:hypothetical protein